MSSFSSIGGVQQQSLASLGAYLSSCAGGDLPLGRGRRLTADERAVREMVLQWKLGRVGREGFRARHGIDPADRFAAPLARLVAAGLATVSNEAIELTREGLLSADRDLRVFYLPQHRSIRYS